MTSDTQWNLVGYARVSTDDQNLDLQLQALRKHGVREPAIYREYISGAAKKRPEFRACLDALRPGDVLVIWKLDRLGRDLIEVVKLADELRRRNVELRSLTENIDTTSAYGKFFFHVIAAFAQLERDLISERTKAGIEAAKARGKIPGRKPSITPDQWAHLCRRMQEAPPPSLNELLADKALAALGWKAGETPKRTTLSSYRSLLKAGAPYPENWQRYLDQLSPPKAKASRKKK